MEISGTYLTIESVKKVGVVSFADYLARRLLEMVEEADGDFTKLDPTNEGRSWVISIISEYEEGGRV